MRHYFDFKLKGSDIAMPVIVGVVAYFLLVVLLSLFFIRDINGMMSGFSAGVSSVAVDNQFFSGMDFSGKYNPFVFCFGVLVFSCLVTLIYYFVIFVIVKKSLESLSVKGEQFTADLDPKRYAWVIIKGTLLTLITLGIYAPWFIKDIVSFFAAGTHYKHKPFTFKGKGITLFAIIVLLVVLPTFLYLMAQTVVHISFLNGAQWAYLLLTVIAIAYLFLICLYEVFRYRWYVDFKYGDSTNVALDVKSGHAATFIMGQIFLSIITLMIYFPMAFLRIYRYFANRVVAGGENIEYRFGFTMIPGRDYIFMLGQFLLVYVTMGIYAPWAISFIGSRILGRTYVEDYEENKELPMPAGLS